jgi:betaine-homocysteine S-methyltransferase
MTKGILERLAEGPVLGDGGYLLELEKRGWVRAGPFTPEVVLQRPEAVRELHAEFRAAGAEVLQALTFYASRDKLATVGLAGKLPELNRQAVRIAREVAGDDCLVAGNLCLTWMYDAKDPKSKDVVRRQFDEQLELQVGEGVDFIIGETFGWLGEALLAVERAKATGLPVMVTVAFENENVTSDGHSAADCAKRLVDAGADIVGINCLRNHYTMMPLIREMRAATKAWIAAQPVAYRTPAHKHDFTSLPEFPTQLDPLQLSRAEMGGYAREALGAGVNYIGACCGAIASHIRAMAVELGKKTVEEREWRFDYGKPMSAVEYYKHAKTQS